MRYMLTGADWSADEAYRMGLVQEVTAPGQQLDRAIDFAKQIATAAPLGVRTLLSSAHRGLSESEKLALSDIATGICSIAEKPGSSGISACTAREPRAGLRGALPCLRIPLQSVRLDTTMARRGRVAPCRRAHSRHRHGVGTAPVDDEMRALTNGQNRRNQMKALDDEQQVNRLPVDDPGFHQSWFPVARARELGRGAVLGVDFLGTRVAVYRGPTGKPVVQSAWCPHLGADLSIGEIVNGQIRCAYHHWRFDDAGICADIPTGGKIPRGARIFTYPSAEAWGLVWAFNGERPLFDVPRIPGIEERELAFEPHLRGVRPVPHWVPTSNGVDFQHLRTLHNLPTGAPEAIEVLDYSIEYHIETASYRQLGLITGTNVSAQHLRRAGVDSFMLFAGAPIDQQRTRSFFGVGVGVRRDGDGSGTML
jgi:nitrite reductase/ring-hydroxylating ferredoxin subunit